MQILTLSNWRAEKSDNSRESNQEKKQRYPYKEEKSNIAITISKKEPFK